MKGTRLLILCLMAIMAIALQYPFLQADPDVNISEGRDAFTDEGLNTCQARNLVNHQDLTFRKSDNFVKTPLFGAYLLLPFRIFGSGHMTARLSVLLLSLAICLFVFRTNRDYAVFGIISFGIVFLQYYLFHYFHFCQVEMLSTALIFLSVYLLAESTECPHPMRSVFLSATFISIAYYLKIQFAYGIVILPLAILIFILFRLADRKKLFRQLFFVTLFLGGYFLLYILAWYLPNRTFFDYVMANQTAGRFAGLSEFTAHLRFLLNHVFYNGYLKLFTFTFYFLFITGVILSFTSPSGRYKWLFWGITAWIVVELHKLSMNYLPTRYLISLYFPMGLIISLVLAELITRKYRSGLSGVAKVLAGLLIMAFLAKNGSDYIAAFNRRAFTISEINSYLAKYSFGDRPVAGAWAPSLSWECKAVSYPVWKEYFNDDVIPRDNPAIIIAENNEDDSNQAFLSQGIILGSIADSSRSFTINRWNIRIFWLKNSR